MHQIPGYNLTPEDRVTRSKWVLLVAAFYGCAALLLLLVAITLAGPAPVQPRGSAALAESPDRSSRLDAAVRRVAQQPAWASSPTDPLGAASVRLDAQSR
jgi:hypothetical protein